MCRKLSYLVPPAFCLSLVLTGVAKADIVAWWRLDDGSGSTAQDRSGNGQVLSMVLFYQRLAVFRLEVVENPALHVRLTFPA